VEHLVSAKFPYDVATTFLFAVAFCLYALWDLRKENKLAALAAQRAALRSPPPSPTSSPPPFSPSSNPVMSDDSHLFGVRKQNWDELPIEELTPLIGRRLIYSEAMMLAHVYLKKGAIVPAHDHINEQFTYVLSGMLRFWIGEHADTPGDTYTDVGAGDVLVIPSHVRHRAEALEETLDVDVFNPPRQDWIDKTDDYLRGTR